MISPVFDTSNPFVKYTIEVDEGAYSIETNTSPVTVQVRFYRTNSGYVTYGTGTVYCTIGGAQYSQSVTPYDEITSAGIVLFDKTVTIAHDADGSKSLYVSAYIEHNAPLTSDSQGFGVDLTTIPRASRPTLSAASAPIGSDITIYTNRVADNFLHTVRVSWAGSETIIATDVATSVAWTIPTGWVADIPTTTSGTAVVYLDTYNSGTLLGTYSVDLTALLPEGSGPAFAAFGAADTAPETVAVTGDSSLLVQGYSTITVTIQPDQAAVSNSGATIVKYIASSGSRSASASWSADTAVTITLGTAETGTVMVAAVDSRGMQTVVTQLLTLIPYTPPVIRLASCTRDNGISPKVKLSYTAAIYEDSIGKTANTVTGAAYMWAPSRGEYLPGSTQLPAAASWTGYVAGDSDEGFASDQSFALRLSVRDVLATCTVNIQIDSGRVVLDAQRRGQDYGVGVCKLRERGIMDIAAGDIYHGGQLIAADLIESGASGIWHWLKWSDGTAICWGKKDYTTAPSHLDAWGNDYCTPDGFYRPETYPIEFDDVTPQLPSLAFSAVGGWVGMDVSQSFDPLRQTVPFTLIRPNNNYIEFRPTMTFLAIGKWHEGEPVAPEATRLTTEAGSILVTESGNMIVKE